MQHVTELKPTLPNLSYQLSLDKLFKNNYEAHFHILIVFIAFIFYKIAVAASVCLVGHFLPQCILSDAGQFRILLSKSDIMSLSLSMA